MIPEACIYHLNTVAVAWNDNNEEENLQRIITQKWIANYPLGLEAWAEYRRTGYPELYPLHRQSVSIRGRQQAWYASSEIPYTRKYRTTIPIISKVFRI